ncbi:MAG: aminopeptidase P family protein [Lentisphaeraceae bacterium]|nr:aminopeptidase P family protein [Lentisphaeraceae bacterium]
MSISPKEYKERRQKILTHLNNDVLIIFSNFEHQKNSDVNFDFRQDSSFEYLTGFPEADSLLVLDPLGKDKFLLFVRPKDRTREIWDGFRYGPSGAIKTFHADAAWNNSELSTELKKVISCRNVQLVSKKGHPLNDEVNTLVSQVAKNTSPTTAFTEIHRLRLIKSKAELDLMRKAADISAAGHNKIMKEAPQLSSESKLEATFLYSCMMADAKDQAYPPIVAGGKNATCLHYNQNNQPTNPEDIVLVDAGCSWQNYASDITRCFPVSGKFTEEQKAIYAAVLKAQKACVDSVKPGTSMKEIHMLACEIMTKELISLGLIKESFEDAMNNRSFFEFFPHNIGHHLGLDVHDCDGLSPEERGRSDKFKLQAGMVVTIEPGIYIQPDNDKVDPKWKGIGIRIEDDVLVTESGHENLTAKALKEISDIEQ